mmetsp:Transcript_75303/g.143296  ORF Transcript_75303/g.143296 Transcript_75303/m.143296 type:complete len:239 (-) Transcript_75303:114-830(-)
MGVCCGRTQESRLAALLGGALVNKDIADPGSDAMQQLFDTNMDMTRMFDKIKINNGVFSGSTELSLTVLPDPLPNEVLPEVKRILSKIVAQLWNDLDKNSNGVLEQPECEGMVQRYLAKSLETIEKAVDISLEQSVDVFITNLKASQEIDADAMRSSLKEQFKALKPKILIEFKRVHEDMMRPNECTTLASQILTKMDLNGDGLVHKAEFEESFVGAINDVLGSEQLVKGFDSTKILG